MQTLDVGEIASITTDWYDGDDQAAEPSAITLTIHPPSGAPIVKAKADLTGSESGAATGVLDRWTYAQTVTAEGLWRYDLEGVVAGATVKLPGGRFLVAPNTRTGPCEPWCTWDEVEQCGPASISALDPAQREAVIDFASEILWNLSGRVYSGICETTRSLCYACRRCYPEACGCAPLNGLDLGVGGPVWGVWDVIVDGVAVTDVRVVNRRWLVRDDAQGWSSGWNVADPDAFRASWAYGRRVPPGGRRAAALFAAEVARTCPPGVCTLPDGTTSINAEGVTYVIDPDVFQRGHTGIALVDEWLEADRTGRRSPPRMFHPNAGSVQRIAQ